MPRKRKTTEEQVLQYAVKYWTNHQAGCDSLKVSHDLRLDNEDVKKAMVNLEATGLASLNKDRALTPISMGKSGMTMGEPILCHVIFPSKAVLTENFYSSDLVRQNLPVFQERVMKGSYTYSFIYFNEEVLRKYLTRPDLYEVSDTISGGHITYTGEDESLYINVRHGRRKIENGRSVVVVFLTDLLRLSEPEQRYWHGYERTDSVFAAEDKGFTDFINVNLEGQWISYKDPVSETIAAIKRINERLGQALFRRTDNALLHAPVENTERAYCDSCNELYKLIGNDSLDKDILEAYLAENFSTPKSDFIHKESKRPLSSIQLMELLEKKVNAGAGASKVIRSIGNDRGKAAHSLSFKGDAEKIYIDMFRDRCLELTKGLDAFGEKIVESAMNRRDVRN